MQKVHLICNAHIDPVWLWRWEEGAAAAVSTFRAAAEFCEETGDFLFCHNEVIVYEWVKEYEPSLFARIQKLVKEGRWHIMGGWYLQPDCNLPSAESFIRQIQLGRTFFKENFGQAPKVAVNFDPFGHSRGMVQIMAKSGYEGYLFMRPMQMELPSDDFEWVGYDGSTLMAHRLGMGYGSHFGEGRKQVETWLEAHTETELGMVPWGVGNHGGGPSRQDIREINELIAEKKDEITILHSTPENYFDDLKASGRTLPKVDYSLRPWAIGCYTSVIRIKQAHRKLENMLDVTERMCAHAAMQGLMEYPTQELERAEKDLCFGEFHDILPGSLIQPGEEDALRMFDHAMEQLSKLRARAFFALASKQKRAEVGQTPILLYNPHPYPIEGDYCCEFFLADQNWEGDFTRPRVYLEDGTEIPSQVEKESSNLNLDWHKKMCFHATLAPMQMTRLNCRMERMPRRPEMVCREDEDFFYFENATMQVTIGKKTGLLEKYAVGGKDYLTAGAFRPVLYFDSADPWEMRTDRINNVDEAFRLMNPEQMANYCGMTAKTMEPVHVIEQGDVRTVIEAGFHCRNSFILMQYTLPNVGNQIEVNLRILYAEKDKMVKLHIPTVLADDYLGQAAFGTEALSADGLECTALKWVAAANATNALTVINTGSYGSDCRDGEIHLSLLRSPAFSGHPIYDRELLRQDRYTPRIDQGERTFTFFMEAGCREERLSRITREADFRNAEPFVLSFFPNGKEDAKQTPLCTVSGDSVELSALRRCRDGRGWVVRLFASSGKTERAVVTMDTGISKELSFTPFEAKTLRYIPEEGILEPAEMTI